MATRRLYFSKKQKKSRGKAPRKSKRGKAPRKSKRGASRKSNKRHHNAPRVRHSASYKKKADELDKLLRVYGRSVPPPSYVRKFGAPVRRVNNFGTSGLMGAMYPNSY